MQKFKNKNFYELLGIGADATSSEIKLAYREMVRIYHPDSNYYSDIIDEPPTKRDEEIFKLITMAYTTLSSPELRSEYDVQLEDRIFSGSDGLFKDDSILKVRQNSGQPITRGQFGKIQRDDDSYFDAITAEDLVSLKDRLWGRSSVDAAILAIGYALPIFTLIGAALFLLSV